METKYNLKTKGLTVVTEELRQRVNAKEVKAKRYGQRIRQYRQNRLFGVDKERFYQEINWETRQEKIVPNAEESRKFWGAIWDEVKEHKQAEWLKEIKKNATYPLQGDLQITKEKVEMQCRKMPNWKVLGLDRVQGF